MRCLWAARGLGLGGCSWRRRCSLFLYFSNHQKLIKHRSIKCHSLGNYNWEEIFKQIKDPKKFPNIDDLCNTHLKNFIESYGLEYDFKLENKLVFSRASYIRKAHYAFEIWNPESGEFDNQMVKMRGFKFRPETDNLDPLYHLLLHILKEKTNLFKIENNGFYKKFKKDIKSSFFSSKSN